ncbi:hypothetical protein [Streptosporangium lutulentum]|uniref:Uncharacterized protein n=1 Tax=Streptosporangium lutulentum TaxID=1461250 RepID=A0ABT9QE22_9ACTN|nr:hypothetical protein [Streptosporangium lutulentum]MDP9844324.1 hypothetical protein [Streptosporangium lutulentum]
MADTPHAFDPDLFVSWLAEVGSGRLDRLRRDAAWAARTNGSEASQWIESLEVLGFLRLNWTARTWRTQALTLTALPGETGVTLLTGTRPAPEHWMRLPGVVVNRRQQETQIQLPSTVWFQGHDEQAGAALGATLKPCAAERIAGELTPLVLGQPGPGPARNTDLAPFDTLSGRFGWPRPTPSPRAGLYEYLLHGRIPQHAIFRNGQWYPVDRSEGICLSLPPGAFPFRWRAEPGKGTRHNLGRLIVDHRAALPRRQREAAVLCTGLPPIRLTEGHAYDGVPKWIAEKIAKSSRRKLEIQ